MKGIITILSVLLAMLVACGKTTGELPVPGQTTTLRAKDSLALIAIYNACDGRNWTTSGKQDVWSDITKPINDTEHWKGIETKVVDGELRVTQLFLVGMELEGSLPEEMGNLTQLVHFDVSHNRLTGMLPKSMSGLTKIKYFNVGNNRFAPQKVNGIENMEQLEHCILRHNSFTGITDGLGKLQQLKRLDINGNRFEQLPPSIGKLKKMQQIHASNNQLNALPSNMGELSGTLTHLVVSGNKFTAFPESVFQLSALRYLDISDNNINNINLPEIRKKLPTLTNFKY